MCVCVCVCVCVRSRAEDYFDRALVLANLMGYMRQSGEIAHKIVHYYYYYDHLAILHYYYLVIFIPVTILILF